MSEPKEWTLMFYFAGDNNLAPLIVSLLKEIKDAGFQQDIDVLVYFDPSETGAPTRLYNVNQKRKEQSKKKTHIGDGKDPFVRSMDEDKIDPRHDIKGASRAAKAMRQALKKPDTFNADEALKTFLGFCREQHRAKRYMLYVVGHGLVVGNDAFLPDENPVSGITLIRLGEILGDFADHVKADGSEFELVTLHSCSMSAIEVAYELKGTANYMIASEGPSFVGSWPYRQILKKTFDHMEKANGRARKAAKGANSDEVSDSTLHVQELIEKLYFLTLFNSTDFMRAGYSHDLALCSLDPEKFNGLTDSIRTLADLLIKGLKASQLDDGSAPTDYGTRLKEDVLLAHWEAQSYWQESYTDLFDFCKCLLKRRDSDDELGKACSAVKSKLDTIKSGKLEERFRGLVIHSENFGSKFQYSHGLSVYFPWSRPIEIVKTDNGAGTAGSGSYQVAESGILANYLDYAFTEDLKKAGGPSWLDFLECYFNKTKRQARIKEDGGEPDSDAFTMAKGSFNPFGPLSGFPAGILAPPDKPTGETDKPTAGTVCTCPSIKNYPEEESTIVRGKKVKHVRAFHITEGALMAFKPLRPHKGKRA